MRIGLLAPPFESVPPLRYGGTERVVATLADTLVRSGHDVTLFASGDSRTKARLVATVPSALWHDPRYRETGPLCSRAIALAYEHAGSVDILHNHFDHFAYPAAALCPTPTVTTLHGSLEGAEQSGLYEVFHDQLVVSISMAQRRPLPALRWVGNVHHGFPTTSYAPSYDAGRYLAFCGRFAPEKGADLAIDAAVRAGIPIRLAGRVPQLNERNPYAADEKAYFDRVIAPKLAHPLVEYVGELADHEKQEFYAGALALLAPIRWNEPFGLIFIEALACGTPVLACPRGSVRELIEHGRTGLLCVTLDDFAEAIRQVDRLDRRVCRRAFERRFSAERMARAYVSVYERVLAGAPRTRASEQEVDGALTFRHDPSPEAGSAIVGEALGP